MATDDDKKTRSVLMAASAWDKIKALADRDKRTINAQLEYLVEREFDVMRANEAA